MQGQATSISTAAAALLSAFVAVMSVQTRDDGVVTLGVPRSRCSTRPRRNGVHFTKRQQLPTQGAARHPQLAVDAAGNLTVVWDEQNNGIRKAIVGRGTVDASGVLHVSRQPVADESATYPVVSASADATFVVWTSGIGSDSVLRVQRYGSAR